MPRIDLTNPQQTIANAVDRLRTSDRAEADELDAQSDAFEAKATRATQDASNASARATDLREAARVRRRALWRTLGDAHDVDVPANARAVRDAAGRIIALEWD